MHELYMHRIPQSKSFSHVFVSANDTLILKTLVELHLTTKKHIFIFSITIKQKVASTAGIITEGE